MQLFRTNSKMLTKKWHNSRRWLFEGFPRVKGLGDFLLQMATFWLLSEQISKRKYFARNAWNDLSRYKIVLTSPFYFWAFGRIFDKSVCLDFALFASCVLRPMLEEGEASRKLSCYYHYH
jgi:hypothetical protein